MDNFVPGKYARPFRFALLLLLLALLALAARLQLRSPESLRKATEAQQTRTIYIPPRRGELQDCDGGRLDYTVPVYSIAIRPELTRDPRDTRDKSLEKLSGAVAALATALGPVFYQSMPSSERLLRHLRTQPAMPLVLWQDIDAATRAKWLAVRDEHPATELQLSWRREHDRPQLARSWRGAVGKRLVSADDNGRYWNANSSELYGLSGMEKALDRLLAGQGGAETLRTDVLSYRREVLSSRPADNGDACRMTMVASAQEAAETAFARDNRSGAAVAIDLADGSVLVLASACADVARGSTEEATGLNRAVAGRYPLGSVMKPLIALYLLDKGQVSATEPVVDCKGYFQLSGGRRLGCSHVHGPIAMEAAIAQSCNTYFCTLAQGMTEAQFDEFATLFGFGQTTGGNAGLNENAGIPFSPAWVKANRKEMRTWLPGDAAHATIGQGGWAVTPLQVALASAFAITGKLFTPKYFVDDDTPVRDERAWRPEAHRLMMAGLRGCVVSGTGRALALPGVEVIGKTGTAETGGGKRPHAWIMAAAPCETPRYLVVVIVEHGGAGGAAAAPIAREILRELLKHGES